MAAHSGNFAWEIPWTEDPAGLQSTESQRVRRNEATNTLTLSQRRKAGIVVPDLAAKVRSFVQHRRADAA